MGVFFAVALNTPPDHLLLGPVGIRQAAGQLDADVDLLTGHALFLHAVLLPAIVLRRNVGTVAAAFLQCDLPIRWSLVRFQPGEPVNQGVTAIFSPSFAVPSNGCLTKPPERTERYTAQSAARFKDFCWD
jgi:hypothetical protein